MYAGSWIWTKNPLSGYDWIQQVCINIRDNILMICLAIFVKQRARRLSSPFIVTLQTVWQVHIPLFWKHHQAQDPTIGDSL